MEADINNHIEEILVYDTLPSTNDQLWHRFTEGKLAPAVCLTETQTAGRGRRGDQWQSPASGNLYLSLFWPFPADVTPNGLSIAIGISLINTLNAEGINELQLKWPNDILHKRHKLAGILVESRFNNNHNIVVGVGLNFKLPAAVQQQIEQPTTSLAQLCSKLPCRNRLAAKIIQNMIETINLFQHRGLSDYVVLWPQYDALHNQPIKLIDNNETTNAIACGINDQGELLYMRNNQIHALSSSHVSIRFAS